MDNVRKTTYNGRMRNIIIMSAVTALLVGLLAVAAAAEERTTGLERAELATMQGLEKSQRNAVDASGQVNRAKGLNNQNGRLTGRARAAAAITAALERGNGNGNAFGRGNASAVLAGGAIPDEIDGQNHSQAVRDMVHAYNELRRSE